MDIHISIVFDKVPLTFMIAGVFDQYIAKLNTLKIISYLIQNCKFFRCGDVVGFLDGKRYLFEGGSGKLIAVAEE